MFTRSRLAATSTGLALALLAATGCKQGPSTETQAQMAKVATERDRLVQEVAENARMMSEISADLAKVRIPAQRLHVTSESPLGAARDSVVQRIRYVTARISESERKLRESEQRIHDLTSLEKRLRDTSAIGVFTKLSLKNEVDDLLERFRTFHEGRGGTTLAKLRENYDLLVLKVVALLQDKDSALARDISTSREALWNLLKDPVKFKTL